MDVKSLESKLVGKSISLEVRYDDFELETVGEMESIVELEEGIKFTLKNNTSVFTIYDYVIEDEDTFFFMERISDNQELILAMIKLIEN